jgi:hypothetical protein
MRETLPPTRAGHDSMSTQPESGRRAFVRACAALPLLASSAFGRCARADTGFAEGATLVVAGPERGRLDHWAGLIAPALSRGLPAGTVLRRRPAGGDDGVTGANQFEARATPDGHTAMLLPGDAALAWLTGDPRAHFDAARWVPIVAGWTAGVVVGRVSLGALPAGARLRIAAAEPAGPDIAALLGLDLLRIEAAPVFRIDGFAAARAAAAAQAVDAVFLHGEDVPRHAAQLARIGLTPLFSLGLPDGMGGTSRDPLFSDVPTVAELLETAPAPPGPLHAAWRAAASAAQVDFALVLPQLTPAAMVALWRRAGALLPGAPELRSAAGAGVRPLAAPATITASLAPDASALLELRRWLADRYNWQPA